MARIATSIEESKRLLELGIDQNTADMHYQYAPNSEKLYVIPQIGSPSIVRLYGKECIPAWSLGALIELLPPKIIVKDEDGELRLWLNIQKMGIEYKSTISEISEMYLYGDLIVSIIVAIESLVEQGYIKGKEK